MSTYIGWKSSNIKENEVVRGKGKAAYEKKKRRGSSITDENDNIATVENIDLRERSKNKMAHLYRGKVDIDAGYFSAASIQPTRLKFIDTLKCVLASSNNLYEITMEMNDIATHEDSKEGTLGKNISTPSEFKTLGFNKLDLLPTHRCEIQSVASSFEKQQDNSHPYFVSIDAIGSCILHTKDGSSSSSNRLCDSLGPETSWAGVAISESTASVGATHSFGKVLQLFDAQTMQKTHSTRTVDYPTSIEFVHDSTVLLAESKNFSVWDTRTMSQVARECPSSTISKIHTVSCSQDGNTVVVGGQDKTVYVYDTRNWKLRTRWKCPLKYDIISLNLSKSNSALCYAAGLDNEIMCGFHSNNSSSPFASSSTLQQNHHLGFRGDARWVGITTAAATDDNDILVGACENGAIYAVTCAQGISGHEYI